MNRKSLSALTLRMRVTSAVTGAGVAETVQGIWEQNTGKIILSAFFVVLAHWFADSTEDTLLTETFKKL